MVVVVHADKHVDILAGRLDTGIPLGADGFLRGDLHIADHDARRLLHEFLDLGVETLSLVTVVYNDPLETTDGPRLFHHIHDHVRPPVLPIPRYRDDGDFRWSHSSSCS